MQIMKQVQKIDWKINLWFFEKDFVVGFYMSMHVL